LCCFFGGRSRLPASRGISTSLCVKLGCPISSPLLGQLPGDGGFEDGLAVLFEELFGFF